MVSNKIVYQLMKQMVLLVIESQEQDAQEEGGEPDVPGVVEALAGLDAPVGDLDTECNDVDNLIARFNVNDQIIRQLILKS